MLISGAPISAAPISAIYNPDGLPVILADVAVNLAPFTLTADTTVRGSLATAALNWGAFTLSATTELETDLTASLTWDPFTLDALAEQETEAEVTAIWQVTFTANISNPYRYVRLQNISGTIIRPLDALPAAITRAGTITRDAAVIS